MDREVAGRDTSKHPTVGAAKLRLFASEDYACHRFTPYLSSLDIFVVHSILYGRK
jgi:hypothetical protein